MSCPDANPAPVDELELRRYGCSKDFEFNGVAKDAIALCRKQAAEIGSLELLLDGAKHRVRELDAEIATRREWHQISTAPNNGECVLLAFESGKVCFGCWYTYSDGSEAWMSLYDSHDRVYDPAGQRIKPPWPTRWMPLPDSTLGAKP